MKKYCLVKNGEITQSGELPVNFENVSNFYLLSDDEIKPYGWLPLQTISDNKEIQESVEYQIEDTVVKEIIISRNKTVEEIKKENQSRIEDKWHSVRLRRNNLLKESDIEIVADKWEEMDAKAKLSWTNYRKRLRDIPQIYSNPDDVTFPEKP